MLPTPSNVVRNDVAQARGGDDALGEGSKPTCAPSLLAPPSIGVAKTSNEVPVHEPTSDLDHSLPGAGRRGAAAMGVEGGDAAVGIAIRGPEVGTEPFEIPDPDWYLSPTNGSGPAAMGVEGDDAAEMEFVGRKADEQSILEFVALVALPLPTKELSLIHI